MFDQPIRTTWSAWWASYINACWNFRLTSRICADCRNLLCLFSVRLFPNLSRRRWNRRSVDCAVLFLLWLRNQLLWLRNRWPARSLRVPFVDPGTVVRRRDCALPQLVTMTLPHQISFDLDVIRERTVYVENSSSRPARSTAKVECEHRISNLVRRGHRDSQLQVWSAWKIMKNRVGSTWFEIQAKSSLLGAEKLQGERELSFRTSRRRFPRTKNDNESSIAAYKLQLTPPAGTPPAGTEAPPAGTEGFSSKLFNLASSSLGRFWRMNPRWKAWNPSKATAPFLFPCRQGNERKRRF